MTLKTLEWLDQLFFSFSFSFFKFSEDGVDVPSGVSGDVRVPAELLVQRDHVRGGHDVVAGHVHGLPVSGESASWDLCLYCWWKPSCSVSMCTVSLPVSGKCASGHAVTGQVLLSSYCLLTVSVLLLVESLC